MDGFYGYNQIWIHPQDQYKNVFTTSWGNFSYKVIPFKLKNVGTTFPCTMSYAFHDLAHIILPLLDDLTTRSKHWSNHLVDLCLVFLRCHLYKIRLNPPKCGFCVMVRWLLCFIVSKLGICLDSLKVQAILELLPPRTQCQLQSIQGKGNFLC